MYKYEATCNNDGIFLLDGIAQLFALRYCFGYILGIGYDNNRKGSAKTDP